MAGPHAALLPAAPGQAPRLHLQHGPIDLVVSADGTAPEVTAAYRQARDRFATVLAELVEELPALRRAAGAGDAPLAGPTARRMQAAVRPHAGACFVTPMAAVAGAVADEVLAAMAAGRVLNRAQVNNGGDIALRLAPGQGYTLGLAPRPDRPAGPAALAGALRIAAGDGIGGVATSGRHGRSLSLGVADAVTVLAADAAAADAAATLIANAVDIGDHPAVRRAPAYRVDPDSDLEDRPVVVDVGRLAAGDVAAALAAGLALAQDMERRGLIAGAALFLNGDMRATGAAAPRRMAPRPVAPRPAPTPQTRGTAHA